MAGEFSDRASWSTVLLPTPSTSAATEVRWVSLLPSAPAALRPSG